MFNFFGFGRKAATVASGARPSQPTPPPTVRNTNPPENPQPKAREGAIPSSHHASMSIIEHSEDLPDFTKKLYDELALQPSLRHRVCPIDLTPPDQKGGRKVFAIVLLAEEAKSQVTEELARQVKQLGYDPASPFLYIASKQVMVELARDAEKRNAKSSASSGKKHDSRLWALFESVALFAIENDASDIHFEVQRELPTSFIRFRVDGRMTSPRQFEWNTMEMLDMIAYLYNVHSRSGSENTYNENKPQSCQIKTIIKNKRLGFRWASNQTIDGTKVVMRVLHLDTQNTIRSLIELGYLPGQVKIWLRAIARLGGGILIAGTVGSGKSTTMQTVMSMLPAWFAKFTVEDPVEYLMPGTSQFSVSRTLSEKGPDPFLAVKRQLKRMDPDVVMIGEIRDYESAGLFRDIAESGHRAFSTVHAPSAIDMITLRLVSEELGIPRDVIATKNFLNLLVYQALVPKLCVHCKIPASELYQPEYLEQIKRLFKFGTEHLCGRNENGCTHCLREHIPELNGSKGRVVVAEMIEPTTKMLMLFRDSKNLELRAYIRGLRKSGFDEPDSTGKTALEVAMYHVARGVIDPREVEMKFGSFDQYEQERMEEQAEFMETA